MLRRPRTSGSLPVVPGAAAAEPAAAPAADAPDATLEPADSAAPAPVPPPSSGVPAGSAPSGWSAPVPAQTPAVPSPLPGSAAPAPHAEPAVDARLELDGLALYPQLHRVDAAGREVPLTPTEFLLLETLLRSGQVVRSKAQLARTVRGDDADAGTYVPKADERSVEVHVGNLRRKLADDPNEPRWIQTVRGVGYRMAGRPVAVS
ncbi:winged helix-turn-helix domain-containing protein [Brachybacterium avium]